MDGLCLDTLWDSTGTTVALLAFMSNRWRTGKGGQVKGERQGGGGGGGKKGIRCTKNTCSPAVSLLLVGQPREHTECWTRLQICQASPPVASESSAIHKNIIHVSKLHSAESVYILCYVW